MLQGIDDVLKGSFGYLILQNLARIFQSAFKKRRLEVCTARQLKVELEADSAAVTAFIRSLQDMAAANVVRRQQNLQGWTYQPAYARPLSAKYIRNSDAIFALFSKYAPLQITALHKVLNGLSGYEQLLDTHEKYFVSPQALTFYNDPHISLSEHANSWRLQTFGADVAQVGAVLLTIERGNGLWLFIKKPWAYWPIKVVLLCLLIVVPEREAL